MIISNDFELRRFIPNVMSTVEGEGSLYEKIEPYMGLVEASLSDISHMGFSGSTSPER